MKPTSLWLFVMAATALSREARMSPESGDLLGAGSTGQEGAQGRKRQWGADCVGFHRASEMTVQCVHGGGRLAAGRWFLGLGRGWGEPAACGGGEREGAEGRPEPVHETKRQSRRKPAQARKIVINGN